LSFIISFIFPTLFIILNFNRDPREMNIYQLSEKLKIINNVGNIKEIIKLKMAIYQRYTNLFTCTMFALVGCSAGIFARPINRITNKNRSFELVIFAIIIHYTLNFIVNALCLSEKIPVAFGVWIPNLALLVISVFVLEQKTRSLSIKIKLLEH
ncbi:MAG: LptF/LptG family permease, partial [Cyanobacteria bacterium J06639_18]